MAINLSELMFTARSLTATQAFYEDLLGMTSGTQGDQLSLGYDGPDANLLIVAGAKDRADPQPTDSYWKIGITVADLDCAVRWLDAQNWPVSRPRQFRDIGYMCHLHDPDGLPIELLQQGFEGTTGPVGPGHAIGVQATVAHLTLRVSDLEVAQDYCVNTLGLSLTSVQPVADYGFCLYFYGPDTETPPDPDLQAVGNREWLWQRPYSILELQHLEQGGTLTSAAQDAARFRGFTLTDGLKPIYRDIVDLPLT